MIYFFIEGKQAVIAEDTELEITLENPLFEDSDGYTLSITFPLKDCDANVEIFGFPHLAGCLPKQLIYDARLIAGAQPVDGKLVITDFNESEVTGQFLVGKSAANITGKSRKDRIFINDVYIRVPMLTKDNLTPFEAATPFHKGHDNWVAFPWTNNNSGIQQNSCNKELNKWDYIDSQSKKISWMPLLIHIAEILAHEAGYEPDFTEWRESDRYFLLLCNAWPAAWDNTNYGYALPRWTITQFFSNLEYLLGGEFDWNPVTKMVTFQSNTTITESAGVCRPANVVSEFSCEVSVEANSSGYRKLKNIRYQDQDDEKWKYESCAEMLDNFRTGRIRQSNGISGGIMEFNTWAELAAAKETMGLNWTQARIYHVKEDDRYYIIEHGRDLQKSQVEEGKEVYHYWERFLEINRFGALVRTHDDDADVMELPLSPMRQGFLRDRYAPFWLEPGSSDNAIVTQEGTESADTAPELSQNWIYNMIRNGEHENRGYFDRLFLAYYPFKDWGPNSICTPPAGFSEYPGPITDGESGFGNMTFRLEKNGVPTIGDSLFPDIEPGLKYEFSWYSEKIPSPRSLFWFFGERYVCESLTTTVTTAEGEQLIRGSFFRVLSE